VNGKNTLEDAVKSAKIANKILGASIPIFRGTFLKYLGQN